MLATVIVAASTSTAAFSPDNDAWDDTSGLASEAEVVGAESEVVVNTSTDRSTPPSETLTFVLAAESGFSSTERERLSPFVRAGGTLVVADQIAA